MPDDSSSEQVSGTDAYKNDPYRIRRIPGNQSSITWQCPSTSTSQAYLPYSNGTTQQKHQQRQSTASSLTTRTTSLEDNGFHQDIRLGINKDFRQDSLLTTITTTARASSSLFPHRPFLHSTMTTLSLSEELRKQKDQYGATGWRRHSPFAICCFCFAWKRRQCPSWKWICFVVVCCLLVIGGLLLFFCLPRLPLVTMAPMADIYGQDLADNWGPPQHPFYRTTWQLNLTMDNHPNFIPLHLLGMDLVLYIHPSSWNTSALPSLDTTAHVDSATQGTKMTTNPSDHHSSTNDTSIPFAWSTLPAMTLTADGRRQVVNAIFHINYIASSSNLTDPTFAQFYSACGPRGPFMINPPTLNVSLQISFYLLHYIWLPTLTVYPPEDNGLLCPVN